LEPEERLHARHYGAALFKQVRSGVIEGELFALF